MLYWGWIFLWLVAGGSTTGFDISDCSTKKLLWTYSTESEEEFVLFCDLPELQKSYLSRKSELSPKTLPCSGIEDVADVQWFLQPLNGDPLEEITDSHPHVSQDRGMLRFLTPAMNKSGSYICRPRIRSPRDVACCVNTVLEVKPQTNVSCQNPMAHTQYLLLGSTDYIHCPGLSCQSDAGSLEVTWYKNGKLLSEEKRNTILVDEIYDYHQGMYVCDYRQSNNASSWTVRAVVQVRTIVKDTIFKPDILDPAKDTLEVELGKPLALHCKVRFGFERAFNPVIKWYIKHTDREWEVPISEKKSIKSTFKDEIIERVVFLKEVTKSDLSRKFVCFAQNSIGNTTRSIQLKEKQGVVFLYVLLGTIMALVGVLVASVLLYTYWIEIVLLFRTHLHKDETIGDKKEFDAFISYGKWSSFENETTSSLTEEHLALNLFPEVLENKYGYTLCLLERDVAPGGVYAEDIVSIIKKSRRGIFILSPSYVNGPSIFELQAAVNLALDDQTLKLILIKFCSFHEPESLPHLVKKALRVLPTVTWKDLKSVCPNSRFWTQIRYHMPVRNSKRVVWSQFRISTRAVFRWKGLRETETTGRSSQLRDGGAAPSSPAPGGSDAVGRDTLRGLSWWTTAFSRRPPASSIEHRRASGAAVQCL